MAKNKLSVKKISELTGLSPATVSNALSGRRAVSKEASEKIAEVIKDLGYTTNSRKTLKNIKFVVFRKSGLIIDESVFHTAVIEGVEAEAKEHGLSTIFVKLQGDDVDYADQVRKLVTDPEAAIVLLATEMSSEDFEPFRNCPCPIILLDGWDEQGCFSSVLIDNFHSAFNAVEHLIANGHTEIGYLSGSFRIDAFKSREIGYLAGLGSHNLKAKSDYKFVLTPKLEAAYQDMKEYLAKKPKLPTAFFADNDLIALGCLKALVESGYRVPEDVSIVGFDDLNFCVLSNPALSTIHVNKPEMGREAVRRLIDFVENGNSTPFKIASTTTFVERDSVKKIKK